MSEDRRYKYPAHPTTDSAHDQMSVTPAEPAPELQGAGEAVGRDTDEWAQKAAEKASDDYWMARDDDEGESLVRSIKAALLASLATLTAELSIAETTLLAEAGHRKRAEAENEPQLDAAITKIGERAEAAEAQLATARRDGWEEGQHAALLAVRDHTMAYSRVLNIPNPYAEKEPGT